MESLKEKIEKIESSLTELLQEISDKVNTMKYSESKGLMVVDRFLYSAKERVREAKDRSYTLDDIFKEIDLIRWMVD